MAVRANVFSLADTYGRGQQDKQALEYAKNRNTLAQGELEQQKNLNALNQNPSATPEQYIRAGRSDIANALINNSQNQRQVSMDEAKKSVIAAQYALQSPNPKATLEQNFPELVQSLGQQWAQFDDNAVRQMAQTVLEQYGPQTGVGPTKPEDPGQLEQVTGPDGKPMFVTRRQALGRQPYIKPDRPERADAGHSPPSGYRWSKDGNLEPITGGPADPGGPAARKVAAPLRKEFRSLESVKAYETSLPLLKSAEKAPDTGYGDLQLIYTAGKILDPGSVVREGELALTIAAGSPLQRLIGKTRFTLEKGGRLTPVVRGQIMEMLGERVGAYQQAYDQDRDVYTQYASDAGLDPMAIVGKHSADAYGGARKSKPAHSPAEGDTATGPNGQKIVLRGGQWVPLGQ
jgi:hypothetical protein